MDAIRANIQQMLLREGCNDVLKQGVKMVKDLSQGVVLKTNDSAIYKLDEELQKFLNLQATISSDEDAVKRDLQLIEVVEALIAVKRAYVDKHLYCKNYAKMEMVLAYLIKLRYKNEFNIVDDVSYNTLYAKFHLGVSIDPLTLKYTKPVYEAVKKLCC